MGQRRRLTAAFRGTLEGVPELFAESRHLGCSPVWGEGRPSAASRLWSFESDPSWPLVQPRRCDCPITSTAVAPRPRHSIAQASCAFIHSFPFHTPHQPQAVLESHSHRVHGGLSIFDFFEARGPDLTRARRLHDAGVATAGGATASRKRCRLRCKTAIHPMGHRAAAAARNRQARPDARVRGLKPEPRPRQKRPPAPPRNAPPSRERRRAPGRRTPLSSCESLGPPDPLGTWPKTTYPRFPLSAPQPRRRNLHQSKPALGSPRRTMLCALLANGDPCQTHHELAAHCGGQNHRLGCPSAAVGHVRRLLPRPTGGRPRSLDPVLPAVKAEVRCSSCHFLSSGSKQSTADPALSSD